MKAVLSLLALAASALGANIARYAGGGGGAAGGGGGGGGWHGGGGGGGGGYGGGWGGGGEGGYEGGGNVVQQITKQLVMTYTTLCPVTETHTKAGSTWYETITQTSTVEKVIQTTYTEVVSQPGVTKTANNGESSYSH